MTAGADGAETLSTAVSNGQFAYMTTEIPEPTTLLLTLGVTGLTLHRR